MTKHTPDSLPLKEFCLELDVRMDELKDIATGMHVPVPSGVDTFKTMNEQEMRDLWLTSHATQESIAAWSDREIDKLVVQALARMRNAPPSSPSS